MAQDDESSVKISSFTVGHPGCDFRVARTCPGAAESLCRAAVQPTKASHYRPHCQPGTGATSRGLTLRSSSLQNTAKPSRKFRSRQRRRGYREERPGRCGAATRLPARLGTVGVVGGHGPSLPRLGDGAWWADTKQRRAPSARRGRHKAAAPRHSECGRRGDRGMAGGRVPRECPPLLSRR
ncbi:unnamed protein product [Coccothraustes coccothraustes]